MPIPYGYTRGKRLGTAARVAWLAEQIEALEDALGLESSRTAYPNGGEVEILGTNDLRKKLREFYIEYARLTGDAELLAQVQNNPRFVRLVGSVGYRNPTGWRPH